MIRMTGFHAGDPIKPDRKLDDICMGVSTVITSHFSANCPKVITVGDRKNDPQPRAIIL